jgi:hypothetical protein
VVLRLPSSLGQTRRQPEYHSVATSRTASTWHSLGYTLVKLFSLLLNLLSLYRIFDGLSWHLIGNWAAILDWEVRAVSVLGFYRFGWDTIRFFGHKRRAQRHVHDCMRCVRTPVECMKTVI